jgi:hypothetical protein
VHLLRRILHCPPVVLRSGLQIVLPRGIRFSKRKCLDRGREAGSPRRGADLAGAVITQETISNAPRPATQLSTRQYQVNNLEKQQQAGEPAPASPPEIDNPRGLTVGCPNPTVGYVRHAGNG